VAKSGMPLCGNTNYILATVYLFYGFINPSVKMGKRCVVTLSQDEKYSNEST
jgi:hypothetical protein